MEILRIELDKTFVFSQEICLEVGSFYSIKDKDYSITMSHSRVEISRPIGSSRNLLFHVEKDAFYLCDSYRDFIGILPLHINHLAEKSVMVFGYCLPPDTLLESIYKVPLFSKVVLNIKDGVIKSEVCYNFNSVRFDDVNANELCNIIKRSSLGDSCIMFSGGLDSTLLYKLLSDRIQVSYSSGFEFESIDLIEKQYSLTAAHFLGLNTTYCSFDFHELLGFIPDLILASEEPICHIQSLLILGMIKQHVRDMNGRVILNGQGADGLFSFPSNLYESFCTLRTPAKPSLVSKMDSISTLSIEAKNYYLNIMGDVDHTIHCWQSCAKIYQQKMAFPLFNDEIYRLLLDAASTSQIDVVGRNDKFALKQIAKIIGIPKLLINRKKASFGPRSHSWSKPISECLNEPFDPNQRYTMWNRLNLLIWKELIINGKDKSQIMKQFAL